MSKPKTHMTLDDRIAIQEGLDNNLSVRARRTRFYALKLSNVTSSAKLRQNFSAATHSAHALRKEEDYLTFYRHHPCTKSDDV